MIDFWSSNEFIQNPVASKITESVVVVLVLYGFRFLSHRVITNLIQNVKDRYFWRQTTHYHILAFGLIFLIYIWIDWFKSVFTLLSLIAAALTIVSKELILNLLGYIIILSRYLFHVGDRIQIGVFRGDVIEIGPFYVTLAELGSTVQDQFSGRILKVPNSVVFTQTIANSSKGSPLVWHEIQIELNLTKNVQPYFELIDKLMHDLAEPISEKDQMTLRQMNEEIIFIKTEPEKFIKIVKDKVQVTIRILCKAHKAGTLEHEFWSRFIVATLDDTDRFYPEVKPIKSNQP